MNEETAQLLTLWIQLRNTIDQLAYWYMIALLAAAGGFGKLVWDVLHNPGNPKDKHDPKKFLAVAFVLLGLVGGFSGFAIAHGRRGDPDVMNQIRTLLLDGSERTAVEVPEIGPGRVAGSLCFPGLLFAAVMFNLALVLRWDHVGRGRLLGGILLSAGGAFALGGVFSRIFFEGWLVWFWEALGHNS